MSFDPICTIILVTAWWISSSSGIFSVMSQITSCGKQYVLEFLPMLIYFIEESPIIRVVICSVVLNCCCCGLAILESLGTALASLAWGLVSLPTALFSEWCRDRTMSMDGRPDACISGSNLFPSCRENCGGTWVLLLVPLVRAHGCSLGLHCWLVVRDGHPVAELISGRWDAHSGGITNLWGI